MGYSYLLSADWTLKDVSLSKKIAVLGRSGAGKSTLLQVLCGQRVPGIGRVIYSLLMQEVQVPCYTILNQKPYLFHTSIRQQHSYGTKRCLR